MNLSIKKNMKNLLLIASLGIGLLVSLSTKAANFVQVFDISANTTNTILTNGNYTITGIDVAVASTGPANIKFYDSTNNYTLLWVPTAVTNVGVARVQVTEFVTNAIYKFTTSTGHETNIILRSTNLTWYLRTTNYPITTVSNELPRVIQLVAPTGSSTWSDLSAYFAQGVTVASDTNAVLLTIRYQH